MGPELQAHRQRALMSARRVLNNSYHDAEDAVQEACLKALKTKSPWDGKSSFNTWFTRVTINASLEQIRRKRGAVFTELNDAMRDPSPTPEDILRKKEAAQRLIAALGKLTPLRRRRIELYYFKQLKLTEIAAVENANLNAVKTSIRIGLQKLREILKAAA